MNIDKIYFGNKTITPHKNITKPTAHNTTDQYTTKPQNNNNNGLNYLIGTGVVLTLAGLGVAGYKGKLGKDIQKFLQNIFNKSPKIENSKNNNEADTILEQLNKQFELEELQKQQLLKKKIEESNYRNQIWLEKQHEIKEKEYSNWWNKVLEEKEVQAIKAAQEAKSASEKAANEFLIDLNAPVTINHDLFSGNYPNPTYLTKTIQKEPQIIEVLKELENKTFDSKDLKLLKDHYNAYNPYDLWLRYAIVANNTLRQKGSGAIINEVPNMFKGIDQKELIQKLDKLPTLLEGKKINKFEIGNNKYSAELIGGGCISDVYKITNEATGEQVCMKFARQPYLTGRGQGIFDEVAITQEALNAGVVDVPKLYMANPIGRYATLDSGCITNNGAWQMTELITPDRKVPENGLKLLDWLKSKGLYHGDYNQGTTVGNTFVDLGGIIDNSLTFRHFNDLETLLKAYENGETTSNIIKNYCNV